MPVSTADPSTLPPAPPAASTGAPIGRGTDDALRLAAARRDLRDQIARLEGELARALTDAFPRREPPLTRARSASAQAGPRLLGLGQLEAIRDELAGRIAELRAPRGAQLLQEMRRAPERHRWATVTSADLGEPGCHVWQVRPRFGLIGMLADWWHVKLSSGCPLAG
jgi:hypothetical protein